MSEKKKKAKIATVSLAGCFGCHMSLLDIDEALLDLVELVEFQKSPINDYKTLNTTCDIGLIEGGCCNVYNIEELKRFRKQCEILISVGQCAIMGGIPSMRNAIPLEECFREAYLVGPSVYNPENIIPTDKELPALLNKVYPCHEVVKIDYFLPGCPPEALLFKEVLLALLEGRTATIPREFLHYD
ncbi:MAG: NADP oxidoreductase [Bacteroidota bacterium]